MKQKKTTFHSFNPITRLTETQELFYHKVHDTLLSMKDGEIRKLSPAHANYENFVACCKFFIDNKYDWLNGFSITFNENYTALRKDFLEIRIDFRLRTG